MNKTCLVVDDSRTIRRIICRIMGNLGFSCSEAEDGHQALLHCMTNTPDVIILDWNMPVMNGLEFLLALRKTENGRIPKVLFCTTENGMEFILNGISAGADEYIMKPFDADIIQTKLAQLGMVAH